MLKALTGLSGLSSLLGNSFSPLTLPGLLLWLDPNRPMYQDLDGAIPASSDGDPVGRWTESVSDWWFFNTISAARPTFKINQVGTNDALQFDGVDDHILDSPLATNGEFTIFAIVMSSSNDNQVIVAADDESDVRMFRLRYANASSCEFSFYNTIGGGATCVGPITASVWNLITAVRRSGSGELYINGSSSGQVSLGGTADSGDARIYVGSLLGTSLFLTGKLGHFLLYNSALSDSDRQLIEAWLNTAWWG